VNIIFDFDGTISDSMLPSIRHIAKWVPGVDVDEFIRGELEDFRDRTIQENLSFFKISKIRFAIMYFLYKNEMEDGVGETKIFDGMRAVLDQLSRMGHSLFIVTSHSKKNVEDFLMRNNISVFKHVYSSKALFGKHRLLKKLFLEYKTGADNSVYVGDEVRDIQACKKAGVRIISVTWGYNSKKLLERYSPDFIAESPADILELVSQMRMI
jgi:phosphoglycolate phosphatase